MSLPRYTIYKESGVEWLAEVPNHWQVTPNKAFLEIRKSVVGSSWGAKTLLSLTLNGVIPRDIESGKGKFPADFGTYQDVAVDDIVFCLFDIDETPRGVGLAQASGMITGAYDVFRCKRGVIAKFVFYYYLHIDAFKGLRPFYTGLRKVVRPPTFMAVKVPLPPHSEQTTIAEFLDRETAKIDALVAEQQRLMELLKEKRQAVISHAVTKGLNPNAAMKPSGIEWLGDVPAHWTVTRVRYAAEVLDHMRVPVEVAERSDRQGEYPYYGASGIIDTIDGYLFDEPLVLVCEDGWNLILRTQPVARPVAGKIWVNNHAHIIRPREGNYEFLAAAIELAPFEAFVSGMRQPKLTIEMLKDLPVALPPDVAEQNAIRDFMQCASHKFDSLTAEAQRAIDLLQERRTALISAAVTGQIDVRNFSNHTSISA